MWIHSHYLPSRNFFKQTLCRKTWNITTNMYLIICYLDYYLLKGHWGWWQREHKEITAAAIYFHLRTRALSAESDMCGQRDQWVTTVATPRRPIKRPRLVYSAYVTARGPVKRSKRLTVHVGRGRVPSPPSPSAATCWRHHGPWMERRGDRYHRCPCVVSPSQSAVWGFWTWTSSWWRTSKPRFTAGQRLNEDG